MENVRFSVLSRLLLMYTISGIPNRPPTAVSNEVAVITNLGLGGLFFSYIPWDVTFSTTPEISRANV